MNQWTTLQNDAQRCTMLNTCCFLPWSGAWHNWPRGIPRSWRGRTRHEPQNSRDQTFKTWISLGEFGPSISDWTSHHSHHCTSVICRSCQCNWGTLYVHHSSCCTMLHVLQLGSIAIGLTDSLWHTLPPLPFASGSIEVVIPCLNSQDHWVRRPKTASAAISGDLISTF